MNDAAHTAFVFPGQGSQTPGMGRALAEEYPAAREVFRQADEILGRDISRVCFEGSPEDLRRTENTQPALYVASAAALAALREQGVDAAFAAGHSLGEYSALHAAGAVDFATGLRLVDARARAMEAAARERPGAMAAVMGLDDERVEAVCREAGEAGVVVAANWNSPGQVVLSGEPAAVERAVEAAKAAGARRAMALNVGGAFHSPLMERAAEMLREALNQAEIRRPRLRVAANVDARFHEDPDEIRSRLLAQLTACVRWTDCIAALREAGARRFIEVGPGKVLTGLLKRIAPDAEGLHFGQPSDLSAIANR